MNGVLVELTIKCFPFAEFLLTLLPAKDKPATKALDLLTRGKDTGVRNYAVEPGRAPSFPQTCARCRA
jgi:hypothetical protein